MSGPQSKKLFFGIMLACIVLGFLVAEFFFSGRCKHERYTHLNQMITCTEKSHVDKRGYEAFKVKLEDYIQQSIKNGQINTASVYFRDLQFGPTFGIREYEPFSPASLLKLPMMVTYLLYSEDHASFLDTQVYFEGNIQTDLTQSFAPQKSIVEGSKYTIRELLDYMVTYSDNKSYYILLKYLDTISPNAQMLRDTFIDLGIIDPKSELDDTITVKAYATIFTQLFNSTYFDKKETSEFALNLLAKTDFTSGINQGVPAGITVAHKFGERFDTALKVNQLHDCGIVYFPSNPYSLCVMTKGTDMKLLSRFIGEVSNMVYKEMESRKN